MSGDSSRRLKAAAGDRGDGPSSDPVVLRAIRIRLMNAIRTGEWKEVLRRRLRLRIRNARRESQERE